MRIVSEDAAFALAAGIIAQAKKDVKQRNVDSVDRVTALEFLEWVKNELDAAGVTVPRRIARGQSTGTRNGGNVSDSTRSMSAGRGTTRASTATTGTTGGTR